MLLHLGLDLLVGVDADTHQDQDRCTTEREVATCVELGQRDDRDQRDKRQPQRTDDTEEVIRERQDIYQRETAPLAQRYADRGLLRQVDGLGSMDEVETRISAVLDSVGDEASA